MKVDDHSDGSMDDDPVMEPIIKFIEWSVRDLSIESKMEYRDYSIFLWSNLNQVLEIIIQHMIIPIVILVEFIM